MNSKFFILFFLFAPLIYCQGNDTWQYFPPRHYIAYKTSSTINIDGKADEPGWNSAEWTDYFTDIEGSKKPAPYFKTRTKIIWDDNYFYFYAELEEPHVWADITERDAIIFHNNDFEIFLKPYTEFPQYGEFEINALNTIWDLLLLNTYREDGPVINNWDIKGLKTAVHINGTINNPSDLDKNWSVEIGIPRKALDELKFKSMQNEIPEIWRINFSRVEWQQEITNGKYKRKENTEGEILPENNWVWSPQGVIDMHQPEHWGYVKFSDKKPGTDIFPEDQNEGIIQALFHLYKKQKLYFKTHGNYTTNARQLEKLKFVFDNVEYSPEINLTNFGYEISFDQPSQKIRYVINQNGLLKKTEY